MQLYVDHPQEEWTSRLSVCALYRCVIVLRGKSAF